MPRRLAGKRTLQNAHDVMLFDSASDQIELTLQKNMLPARRRVSTYSEVEIDPTHYKNPREELSVTNPPSQIPQNILKTLAIPQSPSLSEMFSILNVYNQFIGDYEPIDKQGCWIKPSDSISALTLEETITQTLTQQNWIVTSLKDERVLIEPRYTRFIQVLPPGPVFHVTSRDNRNSIISNGLQPRGGGNTRMQRKYPPRTFFAINLLAAFEFADFQCLKPPLAILKNPSERVDLELQRNTDIWRVRLPNDARLRHDVLFTDKAGWLEQHISPERLSRVRYWRITRHIWWFLRKRGRV